MDNALMKLLDDLAEAVGARWTPERRGTYHRVLQGVPQAALRDALVEKLETAARMPSAGELRQAAYAIDQRDTGEEARSREAKQREEDLLWERVRRDFPRLVPSEGLLFRLATEMHLPLMRAEYAWAAGEEGDGRLIPEGLWEGVPRTSAKSDGRLSFAGAFPPGHPYRAEYLLGKEEAQRCREKHPPMCDCLNRSRKQRFADRRAGKLFDDALICVDRKTGAIKPKRAHTPAPQETYLDYGSQATADYD